MNIDTHEKALEKAEMYRDVSEYIERRFITDDHDTHEDNAEELIEEALEWTNEWVQESELSEEDQRKLVTTAASLEVFKLKPESFEDDDLDNLYEAVERLTRSMLVWSAALYAGLGGKKLPRDEDRTFQ